MNVLMLVVLCSLFCLLVYIALKKTHVSYEAYSVANRSVGIIALTATLVMTEFNTATLISFSSLGFISGLKALWLPLIFLVGLMFYAVAVAHHWKGYNGVSVVDFFISRYNHKVGFLAAIFLFCAMAGFSATYLKSLTLLFSAVLPTVNSWVISGYLTVITLLMVIRKGLLSIIKVDICAFVLVLIGMPLIAYHVMVSPSDLMNEAHHMFQPNLLPNDFLWSLIPITMFSYILAPWYGQRIFAAKSSKVAFISVMLAALFVFLLYGFGVVITYSLALKNTPLMDAQLALPTAISQVLTGMWAPLGYLLLFLVSSTTLTGVWNAMSNVALEVLPLKNSRNPHIVMTLLGALVTYGLANLLVDNILNKMILANIPVVSLSFALLAGFYWKKVTILGVYVSILVGLLSGVSAYYWYGDAGVYTWYWAFYGIPLMFFCGTIVSIIYPASIDRQQKTALTYG